MLYFTAGMVIGFVSNILYTYIKSQPFYLDLHNAWEDLNYKDPMDEWIEHLLSLHLQQCAIEKKPKEVEMRRITKKKEKQVAVAGWDWVYQLLPGGKVVPVGE